MSVNKKMMIVEGNQGNHKVTIQDKLDLSSFPLLRIDQLPFHDSITLVKCEDALSSIISQDKNDKTTSTGRLGLTAYAQKLMELIRKELALRRIKARLCAIKDDTDTGKYRKFQQVVASTSKLEMSQVVDEEEKINNAISMSPYSQRETPNTGKMSFTHNSAFVVSPAFDQRRRNNNFRSRAKITEATMKARNLILSDEHQKHLFEEKKRHRRELALQRLKEKRLKRNKILHDKAHKRELRRLKQLEDRKIKIDAIVNEMKKVAIDTKSLIIASGNFESKGDEIAAMAAAKLLDNAGINDIETDSGSSLASEIDHDTESDCERFDIRDDKGDSSETYQSRQGAQAKSDDNFKAREVNESVCDDDNAINGIEDRYDTAAEGIDIRDTCDTSHRRLMAQKNSDETFDAGMVNESICDDGNTIYGVEEVQKSGLDRCEQLDQHGIEKWTGNDYDANGKSNHDSHIALKCDIMNRVSTSNDSMHAITKENRETDQVQLNSASTPKISWQYKKYLRSDQTKTHTVKKYAFTEMFPTFYSIFTAFSHQQTKAGKKSDMILQKERECLAYQVILQNNLSNNVIPEMHENFINANEQEGSAESSSSDYLFKVNSSRAEVSSIISEVLTSLSYPDASWKDLSMEYGLGNCWNLLWTWKKPKINPEHLLSCQKINRFQNTSILTRKDLLKKKLETFCAITHSNPIMPKTFVLPGEYNQFISSYNSCKRVDNPNNIWIIKPIGMSRGRGISVVNDVGNVSYSSPSIVQKYVSKPLLFWEHKFDLRLYITVLSFNPLDAYIYKEGFARFSSKPYNIEILGDIQIHLTNSSIQKEFTEDIGSLHPVSSAGSDGGGNKVKVSWLWKRLDEMGISSKTIWKQITDLCFKTLSAVNNDINHQPNSFEVFGFDVIIDSTFRPWLIEVNSCPSLARDTDLDVIVKEALIEDTIKLVRPTKIDRIALKEICERRLHKVKASTDISSSIRDQLEKDLRQIFCHRLPRKHGEYNHGSNYEYLIPPCI